jgi:hypothetical protein
MDQEILSVFIKCTLFLSLAQVFRVVTIQIIVCCVVIVHRLVRLYLCFRSSNFSEILVFTSRTTRCHTTEDNSGHIIVILLLFLQVVGFCHWCCWMLKSAGMWCHVPVVDSDWHMKESTVELHLSGLTGMASHPDTQKIWITGFFFENRLLPLGYRGTFWLP